MSNQELLTFLFNAIALGFLAIAAMDFGTRLITTYKQVSPQKPSVKLPPSAISPPLPQLPDPWLLPLPTEKPVVVSVKLPPIEEKHLRLLPPAKEISLPASEDLLLGLDIDKLKLRQVRKIAKVLGIPQKVNGRDQRLDFLRSQIKAKLQKETLLLQSEVVKLVNEARLAS